MIKISDFSLFSNFRRVTSEFHEEKARVKIKSLTFEREHEFSYAQVAEIDYYTWVNSSQMNFAFMSLVILGATFVICARLIYANLWLFRATQALYVISVILFLTSFIKNRYYYFRDKNKKVLLGIRVTPRNYKSIVSAIDLVERKSGSLQETAFDQPFPESQPLFQLTNHDIPNYFNKRQTRFYEDRFIEFDTSMMGASVSNYTYDELSDEVLRGRQGNSSWESLFWFALVLSMIVTGFYMAFDFLSRAAFLSIIGVLATIWVISFLMRFVKHEIVAFADKNDEIVYFTWVSRSNKETVEKIIEFVQSKTSPATNDELLKEQV